LADFSNSIAVLRRWSSFSATEPFPADFAAWKQNNSSKFFELAASDPELVSLLSGSAPAGLVADALQGSLSPTPKTKEQRRDEAKAAEVKQLIEANPYKSRNLTQAMRLEELDPAAAKRLRTEAGVQTPKERNEAAAAKQQAHELAFQKNLAAGIAKQQAQMLQAAQMGS